MKTAKKPLISFTVFTFVLAIWIPYVYAASSGRIIDILEPIDYNRTYNYDSIQPSTVLDFPLTADMFDWSEAPGEVGEPVTKQTLRSSNITISYRANQAAEVIKEVTIGTTKYNDEETASVRVSFAEELVSVDSQDFILTVYLNISSSRVAASEIKIYGTFENKKTEIGSNYDYMDTSSGEYYISSEYISKIELYLGNGVSLFTSVQANRKFYAIAQVGLQSADAQLMTKNPGIATAVRIKYVGLTPTGNCVSLRGMGDYYVYASSGKYLGTTDDLLPFHNVYYLATEKIKMVGDGSGDTDTGSTGIISGNTEEEKAAADEMADAAAEAAAAGSGEAEVLVKDQEKISYGELEAMFKAASAAKMKASFKADTLDLRGKYVQGRITINPAMAVNLDGDVMLGVYTSKQETGDVLEGLQKVYRNEMRVVHLSHEGSYSMIVSIAARVSTKDMDIENLYFYSMDHGTKKISKLVNPQYYVDRSNYLHFNTMYGGDIIVSEGPLTKK